MRVLVAILSNGAKVAQIDIQMLRPVVAMRELCVSFVETGARIAVLVDGAEWLKLDLFPSCAKNR